MCTGEIPMTAKVPCPWVDVKDVALAHYRALVRPAAANKRFILDSGLLKEIHFNEMTDIC